MNQSIEARELDALIAVARTAEPPALSSLEARRAVRGAVEQAERRATKSVMAWAWAAAALVCLGLLTHAMWPASETRVEVGARHRSLRFALRSGDSLVAAPGSQLAIVTQDPELRQVRVERGEVLFDVRPLGKRQHFVVETSHAELTVVGTVFTVAIEPGRTVLRVYEGRVRVDGQVIEAGRTWASSGAVTLKGESLQDEALQAAGARRPRDAEPPPRAVAGEPTITVQPVVSDAEPVVSPLPAAATADGDPKSGPEAGDELTPAEARSWLQQGLTARALAAAQAHSATGSGDWLLIEADALRAQGRFAEALVRYQGAARVLSGGERAAAGYAAAALALQPLRDPVRALALLDAFALDDDLSAQRERATVLRIDALLTLGQPDAVRVHALRYLSREPETGTSARLRALLARRQGAN
jgi:hypothetical protein